MRQYDDPREQVELGPLFEEPIARNTDPETSHEAAEDATPLASAGRVLAWRHLGQRAMTDYELSAATGLQWNSIGKRRCELMQAGLVQVSRDAGGNVIKRPAPSGSMARVWELTEAGKAWKP